MLTCPQCINENFGAQVRLYAGAVGYQFISMDDVVCLHTARMIQDFLWRKGIARFDWPASSKDMKPVEPL